MSTLVKFLRKNLRHVFLLTMTVALTWIVTSCETEYIPDNPDVEEPTFSVTEGNFGIEMHFATFGEEEEHSSDTHSLLSSEQIAAGRNMEPETNVIRVKDDLFIYATLSVDNADKAPNDKAPAVKTRAFNPGANIRIAIYDSSTITSAFTKLDEILYRDSLGELVRADGSGFKIQLNDGYYKLIAYSYNTTTPPPSADLAGDLINVDSGNDLIWGESPTVLISGNSVTGIPITMYHKMSQVKLVAKMADGSTGIYGFGGGVSMQGYAADLATFTGVMSKNSTVATPLAFTFPTVAFPVVSVTSATRTVYTDGDIPTIIRIGTLSIGSGGTIDTTITNIPATFAKSLLSGYSYTMTMNIGESPDITDDEPPQGFVPYVGAFWRASQTGERLLRMKVTTGEADSVWTARVIEGGDWIMLDKGQSADPNVGNPSAAIDTTTSFGNLYKLDPGSASDFVSGFATMNPGEDEIYFRIGLRSTLPGGATAAPRYGVVLLTYGNNRYRHRIWIRQGEGDDFLMRNSDPLTGGNRTLAAR
ncbi:MAG: fimbrillin family protein, partial [Tannerella sp.]|nr:fimbrillin family protein [Tannerella sp.]